MVVSYVLLAVAIVVLIVCLGIAKRWHDEDQVPPPATLEGGHNHLRRK